MEGGMEGEGIKRKGDKKREGEEERRKGRENKSVKSKQRLTN